MLDTNFGTDPEIFIVDANQNCIPPAALKEDFGFQFIDEKTMLQDEEWKIIEDGAATEINIHPSSSIDTIFDRISRAIEGTKTFARDYFDFQVKVSPSVIFDIKRFWEGRGEDFKTCVMFGCDPDLDIYSGEYSTEIAADEVPNRFGGGHIHMQSPTDNNELFEDTYYYATRLMDILVGNTAVAVKRETKIDIVDEVNRLKFYGRPGKIRLQNYDGGVKGIEYRTPSNFWITNKEHTTLLLTLMNTVFNLIQHPADASKILEQSWHKNAPKNIINFNQPDSMNIAMAALDELLHLKYLSYEQVSDFVPLLTQ
jgi:hypothetical protein